MKKILFLFAWIFSQATIAREGMWLPQLLSALNESDMKSMGLEIPAEDIYSTNKSSLKDAVVLFGGGCTGEIISNTGLLITNHHCGFYQIQSLSTIQNNYLQNGYWSGSTKEEIPCPGLTVTFIRDITEITSDILSDISDTTDEDLRNIIVNERIDSIKKKAPAGFTWLIKPFFNGNKFYRFTCEVFSDIRFVGAPPQDIGKFGGETDNWMWPRHTGDFSLFRIYANKENKPAAYAPENIPYVPRSFIPVNIGGIKENDFIFVYGFPGKTNEYLPSSGLKTIALQTNPNRIAIREIRLDEMRNAMRSSDTIQLKYAAKFSTLENSYKKWKGELLGLERFDVLKKKSSGEEVFKKELLGKGRPADTMIFTNYNQLNNEAKDLNFAIDFYAEALSSVELLNATARFNKLIDVYSDTSKSTADKDAERKKCLSDLRNFYKNYDAALDKRIAQRLFAYSYKNVSAGFMPPVLVSNGKSNPDFQKFTSDLFGRSLITDSVRLMKFLDAFNEKRISRIKNDPAYVLMNQIADKQQFIQMQLTAINQKLAAVQRKYMADLMKLGNSKPLYPDANLTLRISYGRVEGMAPADGIKYRYFTTADGILQKAASGNYDYHISDKLSEILRTKDFGQYGVGGQLPVAFLASAHTTGGNSGSPVLNAKGELVGVNYDRMWEGVMSDYYYDESYCRNICLDIRYALFIIDKYASCKRLIEEMKIVR